MIEGVPAGDRHLLEQRQGLIPITGRDQRRPDIVGLPTGLHDPAQLGRHGLRVIDHGRHSLNAFLPAGGSMG